MLMQQGEEWEVERGNEKGKKKKNLERKERASFSLGEELPKKGGRVGKTKPELLRRCGRDVGQVPP